MHRTLIRPVVLTVVGTVVAGVIAFGAIAPPEHCPQPTSASLEEASTAAVQWFERNQQPDGTWLYEYDRSTEKASSGYNIVRHAGAIMGLYQAASDGVPGALESADRGVEWVRDDLVENDDWTALAQYGRAPVGGTALLVAGLAERRFATGDPRHDDLLRSLGRFLVRMTLPDGAVIARYDTDSRTADEASRSKYYTGEAYWAIARLHRLFPNGGYGVVSDRIGHYLATSRDDVEDHWPPIPDHWVAYGLAETVLFPERDEDRPLTDAELSYARTQAGLFGSGVRWVSQQNGPWGELVRGTKELRGGGYGVMGEALSGFWRVAQADDRLADLRTPIGDRTECIAGLAIDAQHRGGDTEVDGAWFIDDVTRMDDQQHATSALLRTTSIVELTPSSDRPKPSKWLWGLALLAVLNPLAIGMAVPRREGRAERAKLGALGGLAGGLLVLVVAALGDPLFDLLDVSRPAGRLAMAAVAGILVIARMVRLAPGPGTGPDGFVAALVPVAIPVVTTPALVLLGLSAGADHGVGFVALCLALGIGLLTAVTTWLPDEGPWRTVAAWAQRLISAAAVVACVLLVIDGVLDV